MKIITHTGKAHLDDFVSCALAIVNAVWRRMEFGKHSDHPITLSAAIAETVQDTVIYRRDPTVEELEDKDVLVLDVGRQYDPNKGNFDHHQLPKGSKDSAMTLFAANIGLPNGSFDGSVYKPGNPFPTDSLAEFMETTFPWFRTRAEVDSCGPFATAKAKGVKWGTVSSFLGPFEDMILGQFEEERIPMNRIMLIDQLATMILCKHESWEKVLPCVNYDRPRWGDRDFTIADFTAAYPEYVEVCSDMITKYVHGVAIFHDNRGDGLTLRRLHDDPRIDFTMVKDDPEVAFCHNGGFIVKTKSKNLKKAWRLIEDAYIGK